ncbi:Sphingosine-1-phosphate lyase 1 [Cichlidogyrus casuarinus]|uniref:sphinganine-1-phosphate aldolase n=1 Tax=Cichlidogyrus casuarinus TaxID=1844966 RepID=A0ABD2Q6D7_9PLAT
MPDVIFSLKLVQHLRDGFKQLTSQAFLPFKRLYPGLNYNHFLVAVLFTIVIAEFLCKFFSLNGSFKSKVFKIVTSLPFADRILHKELDSARKNVFEAVHGKKKQTKYTTELPEIGLNKNDVLKIITNYRKTQELDWKKGFASGTVYANDPELEKLMVEVFKDSMWSNPLHPDIFPDLRRMEAETVRMVLNMYHGDKNSCGTMTSGGTESIIMACRSFKERAKQAGIARPNIIAADSAHAAFDKAADYFEMDLIHVPVDETTRKVNLKRMEEAINSSTCMLVASAPSFAHGAIDPVPEIAELGLRYNIPVHVDCCLGGFLLPFMEKADFRDIPIFDFRLPGVTSISCDTHKYGFAPKGTSVIMYRDDGFRQKQFFCAPNWTGGVYASPTIAGSRPGALIALTWASLMYHGLKVTINTCDNDWSIDELKEGSALHRWWSVIRVHSERISLLMNPEPSLVGYVDSTTRIVKTARMIARELAKIPGIRVMGDPKVCVVAFTSDEFDIYQLSQEMSHRPASGTNWSLNVLQFPSSIHLCVTDRHTESGRAESFIQDVREIAEKLMKTKGAKSTGMAAVYGMSQLIPDRAIVGSLAKHFLVACYATPDPSDS